MLQDILRKDCLVAFLVKNSNITEAQLDTYIISLVKKEPKLTLKRKIELRDRRVSKGAFLQTLRQAQINLERSLYTIILAEYLEILRSGSIAKLAQIIALLEQVKGKEMTKEETKNLIRQLSHTITALQQYL